MIINIMLCSLNSTVPVDIYMPRSILDLLTYGRVVNRFIESSLIQAYLATSSHI